jgi:hypothetical protein
MNTALINSTLRTVFNTISGLPIGIAQAADQSQYFAQVGVGLVTDGHGNTLGTGTNQQATLDFDIISAFGVGRDEWRTRYDSTVFQPGDTYAGPGAPLGSVITESTGNRELHAQLRSECFISLDADTPFDIVERCRTALRLPTVLDLLNSAGIAIQKIGETRCTEYDDDNGRRVKAAILEIIFNAADGIEDLPQTTIEIVQPPALTVHGLVTGT